MNLFEVVKKMAQYRQRAILLLYLLYLSKKSRYRYRLQIDKCVRAWLKDIQMVWPSILLYVLSCLGLSMCPLAILTAKEREDGRYDQ